MRQFTLPPGLRIGADAPFLAGLRRRRGGSPARFAVRWLLIGIALQAVVLLSIGWLLPATPSNTEVVFREHGAVYLLVFTLLSAPLLETLVFQYWAIPALLWMRAGEPLAVLVAAVVFAWAHLGFGLEIAASAFPFGLVLGWSYLAWRTESRRLAFWVTAAIHLMRNAIAVGVFLLMV
jgi:membrane protease YdiL (CAAX protease family)